IAGVALSLPALNYWAVTLNYGRLFGVDENGKAEGRFDLSATWDVPEHRTVANRRLVASAVLTKKLGSVSVPIGLEYANRAAFLNTGDYTHGISAHVGLKFNLFSGEN